MKTITLGTFKMGAAPQPMFIQLVSFLENAPKDKNNPNAGFSVGDIRRRAAVADAIEAACRDQKAAWDAYVKSTNEFLVEQQRSGATDIVAPKLELVPAQVQLEDEQYATLLECFAQVDFRTASRDLLPLIDAVEKVQ